MVGPAALTAGLLLAQQHGTTVTLLALLANILIAGAVLWFSGSLSRLLGAAGARIVSKLANLLLAATAS